MCLIRSFRTFSLKTLSHQAESCQTSTLTFSLSLMMLVDPGVAADLLSCGGRFSAELKALVIIIVVFDFHALNIYFCSRSNFLKVLIFYSCFCWPCSLCFNISFSVYLLQVGTWVSSYLYLKLRTYLKEKYTDFANFENEYVMPGWEVHEFISLSDRYAISDIDRPYIRHLCVIAALPDNLSSCAELQAFATYLHSSCINGS